MGGYYFSHNFRSRKSLVTLKYWNAGANVDLELDNIAVSGVTIDCSTHKCQLYGVYISQLIRYARASSNYSVFPETSSSSEKQAIGPGLYKDSLYSIT
jgi:hypothetical protein